MRAIVSGTVAPQQIPDYACWLGSGASGQVDVHVCDSKMRGELAIVTVQVEEDGDGWVMAVVYEGDMLRSGGLDEWKTKRLVGHAFRWCFNVELGTEEIG
jgi:hypothetical protein